MMNTTLEVGDVESEWGLELSLNLKWRSSRGLVRGKMDGEIAGQIGAGVVNGAAPFNLPLLRLCSNLYLRSWAQSGVTAPSLHTIKVFWCVQLHKFCTLLQTRKAEEIKLSIKTLDLFRLWQLHLLKMLKPRKTSALLSLIKVVSFHTPLFKPLLAKKNYKKLSNLTQVG